jgi:DNA-binding NtrC family response regulator
MSEPVPAGAEADVEASPADTRSLEPDADDPNHALVDRFELLVTRGRDAGARFTSAQERSVVGTHGVADFVLHDDTVSRFHCELSVENHRVVIKDLGSRNRTLVNGLEIEVARLRTGATLTLGRTDLALELRPDRARVEIAPRDRFGMMLGKTLTMRRVFAQLERAAATDATVLLEGETGTGKELAAESLHAEGARRDGPFVVVDCAAIPSSLLESELFGYERGAFTGAVTSRPGAFEIADGGTVFLDEIGELPLELQPKLLRVLEKRQVKRIGSNDPILVNVRLIAATNRNLRAEVNAKRFRSDLYFRLAVVEIQLPSLRERPADIPLLLEHLLEGLAPIYGDVQALRTQDFTAEVLRHSWPGNVRELRNYLERCLALGQTIAVGGSSSPEGPLPDTSLPLKQARVRWTRTLERRYTEALLERHSGNVAAAARTAGVDRMHFYRLLWRYGLR